MKSPRHAREYGASGRKTDQTTDRLGRVRFLIFAVLLLPGCDLLSGNRLSDKFEQPTEPDLSMYAYAVCPTPPEGVSFDETVMDAAPARVDNGENDIPLSSPVASIYSDETVSCIHLRLERDADGNIIERRIAALRLSSDSAHLEELVLYRARQTADGWTETYDDDGNGRIERRDETTEDDAGNWLGTTITEYDPSTEAPLRRRNAAPISSEQVRLIVETFDGADWIRESEDDVNRLQAKCVTPSDLPTSETDGTGKPSNCKEVKCTAAQRKAILDAVKSALRRSENCAPSKMTMKPAAEYATGFMEPACMTGSDCAYGETDPSGVASKDNKRVIRINIDHMNTDQFMPTVWHELLHVGLGEEGRHRETMQQLASLLGKGLMVDRVYACELLCFPSGNLEATQCECAACLDEVTLPDNSSARADACGDRCKNHPPCRANFDSPQTLSYCARSKTMCDTVEECRAGCIVPDICGPKDPQTGGYKHEGGNFSRACPPECN